MLTNENYFSLESQNKYMSVSQYKRFTECPASMVAELLGAYKKPTTDALLQGQYIDAYVEGTLDIFKAKHPEIFSSRGANAGQLKANFKFLGTMIERFERDPLFMEYLEGEKQVIYTAEIDGVLWRGKLDVMHPHRTVDLKSIRDFETIWSSEEGQRVSPVEFWGWDLQGAIYQELRRINTGRKVPHYLALVTKQDIPDIGIWHIPDDVLDIKLQEIRYNATRFQEIKDGKKPAERCEKCEYCRSTKVLTSPVDYRFYGG